jgi:DNA (cytosine-5)-methyltransferase 1
MGDVRAIRGSNGYTVVSTFSGCGGSCLGFEMAGYDVRYALEFVPEARATYALNHDGVYLDDRDVREVQASDIQRVVGHREVDVFEGSPPCASFSTAGKRSEGWGKVKDYSDTKQRTDDLFFEYSRILRDLQPKTFVAENVSGLVTGKAKGYFKEILAELKGCGYAVSARMLDASWLGVPQARNRLIFVGVRNDLVERYGVSPVHPQPFSTQLTLLDALPDVLEREEYVDAETGESTALGRAVSREWERTPMGGKSDKYFQLCRPDVDRPVGTITAMIGNTGMASVCHPSQKRKFNLRELRLLSSFPEDFELTGTFAQRCERLGRSVPPLMMKAVADTLRAEVLDKCR